MMEINGDDSQSFVLPLESIDLIYLDRYVRKSREKLTLWSKQELDGELGYYEVKITPQEFNEDDCYYEPSENYKCHICNTDVPTTYFKEHSEGLKHKKNKEIFEKVLERLSKHMNLNINNNANTNENNYYCVSCSKTVKKINKFKHNATDYHKNSLKNIQILNDFHEIFTEIHNDDCKNAIKSENYENDTSLEEEDERHDTPLTVVPDKVSNSGNSNYENFNDSLVNTFNSFNSLTIESKEKTSEKDSENFEAYLSSVKAKYNIKIDLPKVEGEYINIISPKGVKIKIPHAYYQGYQCLINKTYCLFCAVWPEDITVHDHEEMHVRNMLKPVDDNFARPINPMVSHCLVCHESILSTFNHHWVSDKHKKSLQNMTVAQNVIKTEQHKTLCVICNVSIHTHNFLAHTNSKKHKLLQEKMNSEKNKVTKINSNQNNSYSNTLSQVNLNAHNKTENATLSPEYVCEVCQVNVPMGGKETHENGKPHKDKTAQNVANKNISQNGFTHQSRLVPATDTYSVASTNTYSTNSTPSESTSTESNDKLDTYRKLLIYFDDGGITKVKCSICNVKVPNLRQNIIEHMEGRSHRKQMADFNKLLRFTDNAQNRVRCKVCDVEIPYVVHNIAEHMVGILHKAEEIGLLRFHTIQKEEHFYFCECCEVRFANYFDHINSTSHTNSFQMKYEIDKSLIKKYVYEMDAHHGLSLMYRELYRNLLKSNDIIKLNETMFHCNICNIRFGRVSEIDHVLGERHRLAIESSESDSSED